MPSWVYIGFIWEVKETLTCSILHRHTFINLPCHIKKCAKSSSVCASTTSLEWFCSWAVSPSRAHSSPLFLSSFFCFLQSGFFWWEMVSSNKEFWYQLARGKTLLYSSILTCHNVLNFISFIYFLK